MSQVTLQDVVNAAAAAFTWEREQAKATGAARKEQYAELLALIGTRVWTPEEAVAGAHSLGCKLIAAGHKPDGVKVKRSEFRMLCEHSNLIEPDASSWKGTVKAVREARMSREELARERFNAALKALEAARKAFDEAAEEVQALEGADEVDLVLERPLVAA